MIRNNLIRHIISKACECKIQPKRYSALFINGAKASENFAYLVPHIDIQDRLLQKDLLQKQLDRRQIHINLEKIESLWQVYQDLKTKKTDYDKKRQELSTELGKLIKSDPNNEAIAKLKLQIDLIKDNLKKLKIPLWSAEEAAIVEALSLPNDLHLKTPEHEKEVLFTHLAPPTSKKEHLEIGMELNIVNFKKNENYYLKGDAAIFELGSKFYFNRLLRENGMIQFSNPDFVKSLVVEGCGTNHTDPDHTFILHHNEDTKVNADSRLHLTGGGSLFSFLAYYTKNLVYAKVLPMRYFAMGRQYLPSPTHEDSLFHVSQSCVVEYFGVTKTESDLDRMLEDMIQLLKSAYSQIGYHFRVSVVPANKLRKWESLRVVVEMYSSSLGSYIEIANLSLSGDYISKRLMFMYTENKQQRFPYIMSGTLLNVPKFLGCVLEQDDSFTVPDQFQGGSSSSNYLSASLSDSPGRRMLMIKPSPVLQLHCPKALCTIYHQETQRTQKCIVMN